MEKSWNHHMLNNFWNVSVLMYRLFKNNYFFQDKLLQQEYSDFKDYRAKIRIHFVQKKMYENCRVFSITDMESEKARQCNAQSDWLWFSRSQLAVLCLTVFSSLGFKEDSKIPDEMQGMSDRRLILWSSIAIFFHDRDRDRRSPFGQKIAGRSRSRNSMIAIAKTLLFWQ